MWPKTRSTSSLSPDGRTPLRQGSSFEQEFPGASRSASECSINLVRTASLFLGELQRRRRPYADISVAAFQVLAILEGEGAPLPPSLVAERMLTTTGTMTALLDTLTRRGLVVRMPHPSDRRMLLVDITDAGRQMVDVVLPVTHRINQLVFGELSESAREQLIRTLGRLQEQLERLRAEPVRDEPPPPRRAPPRAASRRA
jgi:DNA-binding MarR family transcriptional regulator